MSAQHQPGVVRVQIGSHFKNYAVWFKDDGKVERVQFLGGLGPRTVLRSSATYRHAVEAARAAIARTAGSASCS